MPVKAFINKTAEPRVAAVVPTNVHDGGGGSMVSQLVLQAPSKCLVRSVSETRISRSDGTYEISHGGEIHTLMGYEE